jgi:drug/metabolite transporter superfamily protein YnfA
MFTWGHGEFLKEIFGAGSLFSGIREGGAIMWTALSFLISHLFSMLINFYGKKEYLGRTPNTQMMQPYGRVFVMHLVVLFGGFLVQRFGAPVLAVILLIILKTGIDLAAHSKEHRINETIAL